ncbi:MAG: PRC-barrel domain-containing protein [Armatimonadota bacterium]
MTETSECGPENEEPLILERLSDLSNQSTYLAHYPDIRGWMVINPAGDDVGTVEDLYVNPREKRVEMAEISFSAELDGKRALVPVRELEVADGRVRLLTRAEMVHLAPEFREGALPYERYYEYWSSAAVGPREEPSEGVVRPPGRLELEGDGEKDEKSMR